MAPKEQHAWYRKRTYLHFDDPIGLTKAERIVTSAELVSRHAFYPFISYEVVSKKVKKDAITGAIKVTSKVRPIAYSAHLDAHIYAYYAHLLSDLYETELTKRGISSCVLAFRALDKSNIEFAHDAFEEIKKHGSGCGVVALDVSGFFDTLQHSYLKARWSQLLEEDHLPADHHAVFKSLTKFSTVNKEKLFSVLDLSINNPKAAGTRLCSAQSFRDQVRAGDLVKSNQNPYGIPQGSPISALLSNIYMLDFDEWATRAVVEMGGTYYRYCDDMLFIVPTSLVHGVQAFVIDELKKLGLEINTKKTETRIFKPQGGALIADKPLQYLGFLFDGQRIILRSSSLARYSDRMKRGVWLAKKTKDKYNKIRLSKGEAEKELFKKKLYKKYSYLGRRNFIAYGLRAARIMNDRSINKQLRPLWKRLQAEVEK